MPARGRIDGYSLDDFPPRTISYYSVGGELVVMPWVVSNPILVYDAAAFRRAGLGPGSGRRSVTGSWRCW
ncbi:hypothetical protein ACYT69_12030, partial [Streptococcus pyogenes]